MHVVQASGSVQCMTPSRESVLTQLRKGTVDYCVLACLRSGPAYGLEIAEREMLKEKARNNEDVIVCGDDNVIRHIPAKNFF